MRLFSLARRNLGQRALASVLTTFSILLGTGIVAFLWLAAKQSQKRYVTSAKGFDLVIGPKRMSQLDLVLTSVYLVKQATGFIPLSLYKELHDNRRKWGRNVRTVVPFAYGDFYRGYPILATTDEWFKRWGTPTDAMQDPKPPQLVFADGATWDFTHEDLLKEAKFQEHMKSTEDHSGHDHSHAHDIPAAWKKVVIGAEVARRTGLRVGSTIVPTHAGENSLHDHPEAECEVVGVLESLGSPIDRAIYMPLGCFFRMQEHDEVGAKAGGANEWGDVPISALVVNTRPGGRYRVNSAFQRRLDSHAALPSVEIGTLFRIVGNVSVALHAISWVVLIVAAIGVFVSLYNSMNERRRDVAIMRSLGARRSQIFGIVALEAVLITATGAILGVLAAHAVAEFFSGWMFDQTGVPMSGADFELRELWLILGVTVLGGVAGLLPAAQASRTDVADFLSPDR